MIKFYIYDKEDLSFVKEDVGSPNQVINDLAIYYDFTLVPPPDYNHVWRWIDSEWVADAAIQTPIAELQDTAWSNIKSKRSELLVSGVLVESVDKVFQTDSNSITEYNNIASMIALDNYNPIEWKTEDNTYIYLTIDLFKELQKAISINSQRILYVAEQHKAAMLKMVNPLEYDYSEGWV